ncbi:WhiB family transcriptional regulator [Streptomonospora litoralis]|uniref:Transcriptional regulator WhiB n=1 Tax=Streptomonospora litoralis TaxID=2498135 RepID=A0A4P6Q7T9_9ACTN|nr:WhiB family transcriptional regulator [Streptomonospora litoralis]QBI56868.1 Transcriptional regulator WhiD [Streptomonospora litoralis]
MTQPNRAGEQRAPRLLRSQIDTSWQVDGSCNDADPALFFDPEDYARRGRREKRRQQAKQICAGCPVRQECLEHALTVPERHGVWGGLDEDERRKVRRGRAQAGTVTGDNRADAAWRCEHCGRTGRREGTGPNGEVLIASCHKRWKRAGRPDHVPDPDPVRARAARGAA